MRVMLALAVALASLGVATSGRLAIAQTVHLTDRGRSQDPEFTTVCSGAIRFASSAQKQRSAPLPHAGRLAPPAVPTLSRFPSAAVAIDGPAAAAAARHAARPPASPRAPPRPPVSF